MSYLYEVYQHHNAPVLLVMSAEDSISERCLRVPVNGSRMTAWQNMSMEYTGSLLCWPLVARGFSEALHSRGVVVGGSTDTFA